MVATITSTTGVITSKLSILAGNCVGNLNLVNSFNFNLSINAVKVADVDADGNKDIICNSDTNIFVLKGNGLGSFSPYYNASIKSTSIELADLNNDGKADIINLSKIWGVVCTATNTVTVLNNTGTGFTINTNTFAVNYYYNFNSPIMCDDFNSDGKMDLAVNTYSCTPTLNICYNVTQLTLLETIIVTQPSCYGQCNGSVSFTINGGTPSYTVTLSNGSSSITTNSVVMNGLCAGSYTYTITDSNNNTKVNIFGVMDKIDAIF